MITVTELEKCLNKIWKMKYKQSERRPAQIKRQTKQFHRQMTSGMLADVKQPQQSSPTPLNLAIAIRYEQKFKMKFQSLLLKERLSSG